MHGKSIWRCSGAHWLHVVVLWSTFALMIAGLAETPLADPASTKALPVIAAGAADPFSLFTADPHKEPVAGSVVVRKIAAFDFNTAAIDGFGDGEPGEPHR